MLVLDEKNILSLNDFLFKLQIFLQRKLFFNKCSHRINFDTFAPIINFNRTFSMKNLVENYQKIDKKMSFNHHMLHFLMCIQ